MRTILVLLFVSTISSIAGGDISIGIKGGGNITSVSQIAPVGSKVGMAYGLNIHYEANNRLNYCIGLLYSEKGYGDIISLTDQMGNRLGDLDYKFRNNYLEIPMQVGYKFGNNISVCPAIGIYNALHLNSEFVYNNISKDSPILFADDAEVKNYDFGILGGVNFAYKFSEAFAFSTSLEYKNSITSFTPENKNGFRNRGVSFTLGLNYYL